MFITCAIFSLLQNSKNVIYFIIYKTCKNICHIEPTIRTNKILILASVINSGQVLSLQWLLRLGTSMAAQIRVYWLDTDECWRMAQCIRCRLPKMTKTQVALTEAVRWSNSKRMLGIQMCLTTPTKIDQNSLKSLKETKGPKQPSLQISKISRISLEHHCVTPHVPFA